MLSYTFLLTTVPFGLVQDLAAAFPHMVFGLHYQQDQMGSAGQFEVQGGIVRVERHWNIYDEIAYDEFPFVANATVS